MPYFYQKSLRIANTVCSLIFPPVVNVDPGRGQLPYSRRLSINASCVYFLKGPLGAGVY
ncbi:MAG: hypothetical protein GY820_00010 [Gammaproteobacteria bacterium]|nr:hypothetical protein [Gammaproteobacteria bacterium]